MTAAPARRLRILLTEGASTSAREAVTALGLAGHHIEIMDPDVHCISRFSRFVRKVHRCPPIASHPKAYLEFALELSRTGQFDVLLPIHEQGLIFSKALHRIPEGTSIALPAYEAYSTGLDKWTFSQKMRELGMPQPQTRVIDNAADIPDPGTPFIVKRPMSTASRGVQVVKTKDDAAAARVQTGGEHGPIIIQDFIDAPLEHAQLLFDHGRFVAMHGYRQIIRGAGGGEALKESVWRLRVKTEMEKFAKALNWHGAISLDYLWKDETPYFVDCNPRLVEPMSAHFSGLDLAGLLVRISLGESPEEAPPSKTGVRTRLSLQALLGAALRHNSRIEIIREIFRFMTASGEYSDSVEELTPVWLDWMSALPCAATGLAVLVYPKTSHILPSRGWGAGLLTAESIRIIRDEIA
ncbi:phosphoribosylglycinamide formyltransferase 2 [Terrihabitans soli]|uniref:Phosphoribosylglycinamide formyltransferase 2 n=1 Tax=Terrihabitans soli TaxID=708113 RepID=A0A6S6QR08_9HYPH|nr:ATP-grasp domain-containing protein [Terrihabitans soli]BCJ89702.1 phosphoribosylglycinamide formyltransferase 2 [Terrihabitans soli]